MLICLRREDCIFETDLNIDMCVCQCQVRIETVRSVDEGLFMKPIYVFGNVCFIVGLENTQQEGA